METAEVFSFIKDFGFPVVLRLPGGTELVPAGAYGKQTGQPDGRDRGAELQHRCHAQRRCQKVKKENCKG